MSDAMRQITDGMRLQERAPKEGWVASEHVPITDLMVSFSDFEESGECQYALMVKWVRTDAALADAGIVAAVVSASAWMFRLMATRAVPIPSSSGPAWAGALEPMLCGPVDCDPEDEEEEPARG